MGHKIELLEAVDGWRDADSADQLNCVDSSEVGYLALWRGVETNKDALTYFVQYQNGCGMDRENTGLVEVGREINISGDTFLVVKVASDYLALLAVDQMDGLYEMFALTASEL